MHLDLMFDGSVGKAVEEHLIDSHVKSGYDLLWVAVKLSIEVSVKLLQVSTVHVQEWLSCDADLYKPIKITIG